MKDFTNRLPVSQSLEFDFDSDEIWDIISEPGNLNHTHPFCKTNEVIQWDDKDHSDRLVYLNGLNYIRDFKTWEEGAGYTLLIGEEEGPKSYVVWEIDSLGGGKSRLTITVYPYILTKIPHFFAYFAHGLELLYNQKNVFKSHGIFMGKNQLVPSCLLAKKQIKMVRCFE